jgi:CheY-like chemotaxis protein/cellulose biosynthesis protein BcsQ
MAKILLIDDDPDIRQLMRITLTKLGHKPSLAAQGEAGLRLARSEAFDLIVVDLMMPDLDGFEVIRQLRANPTTKNVLILVLTARAQAVDQEGALAAGADSYLPKPFSSDGLHRRIAELLRQAEARSAAGAGAAALAGRVTVVVGLRGGMGGTTVAVSLAGALLRMGRRVCLVDLSPSGGHVAMQLRIATPVTWANLPAAPDTTAVAQNLVRHDSGLVVLAAPAEPVKQGPDGATFRSTLETLQMFFSDVVVDAAPLLDEATRAALAAADQVIVVCTPEVGAVHTTLGTLRALDGLCRPKSQVVIFVNQVAAEAALPLTALERAMGRAPNVVIPYDPQQAPALARGVPLIFSQPGAALPAAVIRFAAAL